MDDEIVPRPGSHLMARKRIGCNSANSGIVRVACRSSRSSFGQRTVIRLFPQSMSDHRKASVSLGVRSPAH